MTDGQTEACEGSPLSRSMINDLVKSSKRVVFRRTLIVGPHGWGKTTWASKWPKPVILPVEDGCSHLDIPAFPLSTSWTQLQGYLQQLLSVELTPEIPWKTLVVDSADWTEQLIWRHVEATHSVASIGEIDYGRGYSLARTMFRQFLTDLDGIRRRGMHIVVIAHRQMVRIKRTDGTEYDQYAPKLHQKTCEDLMEWCDEMLHADTKVVSRKTNAKKIESAQVAVGASLGRVLITRESPQYMAKSRLMVNGGPLPEEIEVADDPDHCFDSYRALLQGSQK